MIRNIVQLLTFLILTTSCYSAEKTNENLDIRINYNVNFFHFVDYLSQWSKYTGDDVREFYGKYFKLTAKDKKMLTKYSKVRRKLGWGEEINLFNWSYNDFEINKNTPSEYIELKTVINYFSTRKSKNYSLTKILETKYSKLLSLKQQIIKYSSEVEKTFSEIRPYLSIWTQNPDYSKYPVYICFSYSDSSSHGGANGNGVYSEFVVNNKKDGIKTGFSLITHELTHKVTNIKKFLVDFLEDKNSYSEKAQRFLNKNNLTKTDLIEIFESVDSLGFGNPEANIFDEINVYFVSPVLVKSMTDDQIKNKIEEYKSKGEREYERIWFGVSLFKKEYEKLNSKEIRKNDFVWGLIKTFYNKVYFKNFNVR